MALTLNDLFASPDHYLHSFERDTAVFVPMDRAAYRRSIFLDARISPAADGQMALPLATLAQGLPRTHAATAWIFHIAHCGSTLLARALDDEAAADEGLVLREPLALRQAAVWRDPARLRLAAAMLGKRYRADAPTLVKANVPVNFVLPELAALAPDARAILLYLPWRDWLLAILRSDNHRQWLRSVTGQLAPALGDLSTLADAERAAALWSAQVAAFARVLALLPNARALDAETFFADPAPVLVAAARHLALPIAPETLEATARGPLFATYSKNPGLAFDNAARLARRAAAERDLAPELAVAETWLARHGDTAGDAPLVAAALTR